MYICTYTHIHIYTYTHIHIYIYIYIYIYNVITQRGLQLHATSSLVVVAGPIRPFWASLAASDRLLESFKRPKSCPKAARASLTGDFRRSWVDFGSDFRRFSWCFEVRSRGRLDPLRIGPNLRFCRQA